MHDQTEGGQRRKRGDGGAVGDEGGGTDEEAVGDENLSDAGSDAELPGDLADYDGSGDLKDKKLCCTAEDKLVEKVPEFWGKKALRFVFKIVKATEQVTSVRRDQSRLIKMVNAEKAALLQDSG
ncbi:unnamed protein product, partial [Pylaiella littoralis]